MISAQELHEQVESGHLAFARLSGTKHFLATLQIRKVILHHSDAFYTAQALPGTLDAAPAFATTVRQTSTACLGIERPCNAARLAQLFPATRGRCWAPLVPMHLEKRP